MSSPIVETEFLVVGAGPAGAGLASFLGQNGLTGLVISAATSTADTQRAHVTNPFALECLRDLGIEEDAMRLGETGKSTQSLRFAQSMVGTEYAKVKWFGGHIDGKRDIETASPCTYLDLPQTLLEPLLIKQASLNGFPVRYNTKLTAVERDASTDLISCSVIDLTTGISYTIRTRFLFGADGGRSQVARSFGLKFRKEPSQGTAVNVVFKADLDHLMRERGAMLHWIVRPDIKHAQKFGRAPVLRTMRPWREWVLTIFNPGTTEHVAKSMSKDDPELVEYIKELIGDATVDVEVEQIDGWHIRENVAEKYSDKQDVFILGDAAHQHPPSHGLGSNTAIQDAYNLGWKAAYVAKGFAGPALLDSFSAERQPVGATLVAETNVSIRDHIATSEVLGLMAPTPEEGVRQVAELYASTKEGAARRERLNKSMESRMREGNALGLAMNQFYVSSAIYLDDEPEPRPDIEGNPVLTIQISTYPGSRLPHAWLDVPTRRKEISTHDLAGHASFALFYGNRGENWAAAVANIVKKTGIPIKAHGIGFGLEHHDVYRTWQDIRGVEEDGCVLVRPDRFIAWRSKTMAPDCEEKLSHVLDKILSRPV